jgi:hypothetical protein
MINTHSFHIPVMGLSFTIDTPLKVSQFGINSVVSLGDDILLEKLRKVFCNRNNVQYEEITAKTTDFRAKRITAYLNLLNDLASEQFEKFKKDALQKQEQLRAYIDMLPKLSPIRLEFYKLIEKSPSLSELSKWMEKNLTRGSIDVNIMTKVDTDAYYKKGKLPSIYNTAHASLRGYANSDLTSSIVLSAGLNPSLYSYMTQFDDFYPNENAEIKKKIIIKVSDYRSALIQGKFLAKKGLWVSEFRIESGLNCGGHAFATEGYLLGPILEEFKEKRQVLTQEMHDIYIKSFVSNDRVQPKEILPLKISAQGGVGTAEEHEFLLEHYQVDSVGWGSPFLLVSEATTVDEVTLNKLVEAKEDDLYLSHVSPLGVMFNNLKNNTKEEEKNNRIKKGKPGAPCVKKYLAFNKEFSDKGLCTASSKYQSLKIKELNTLKLPPKDFQKKYEEIVVKECLCTGLGSSILIANNMDTKIEGDTVSMCPGPNIAYFSKTMTLKEITDHIYGRINVITRKDRPNMFMKELQMYFDYLKTKLNNYQNSPFDNQIQYFEKFVKNLESGLNYYQNLCSNSKSEFKNLMNDISKNLENSQQYLQQLCIEIENQSQVSLVNK